VLAGEHGVPAPLDLSGPGQVGEQVQGAPGHPVLGVVDVEVADLDDQLLAPSGILGEEAAEVGVGQVGAVLGEGGPRRGLVDGGGHDAEPTRRGRGPTVGDEEAPCNWG
jgi:hypothetical protein